MNTSKVAQQYWLNQWAKRIHECRSSGQTVTVWCVEHNIKLSSYFYWLRRVREAACESLPALNTESNQIVPIDLPLTKIDSGPSDEGTLPDIVIRIGTATIEVHNNASQTLLKIA